MDTLLAHLRSLSATTHCLPQPNKQPGVTRFGQLTTISRGDQIKSGSINEKSHELAHQVSGNV